MIPHETFMRRAVDLARLGAGNTWSNPMVGAVLVHNERVIGEGYHRKYGESHAEVNCLDNVAGDDLQLIPDSVLYVTLEPCSHFGKTPPCADLIVSKEIKKVVIGSRDPFPQVDGRGIKRLMAEGVDVQVGILEQQCLDLNKRFFAFHTKQRPYIILKWAQTGDHFISGSVANRLMISNDYTNRLVHKWRSEEMAILVGTNTARSDNPSLTNRLWNGGSPLRIVIDNELTLPSSLNFFNGEVPTVVINKRKDEIVGNLRYVKSTGNDIVDILYRLQLNSVIVEGGNRLLTHFIAAGKWDEARIITNTGLFVGNGTPAPVLTGGRLISGNN